MQTNIERMTEFSKDHLKNGAIASTIRFIQPINPKESVCPPNTPTPGRLCLCASACRYGGCIKEALARRLNYSSFPDIPIEKTTPITRGEFEAGLNE